MKDINKLTILECHTGLKGKEFSATELTQSCLNQIKLSDLNAFITITEEEALSQAEKVDAKIAAGNSISPLAGIPYAAKDLFLTKNIKTTAGSKILENYIAPYESTTTQRLKDQGAVMIGKTNMDEFAMGTSTENSGFGPVKNPHDLTRVPGGSSGGSAAAVAADECIYSIGTDTGGSIRQPASMCGVVGLKPTYGRTSRYGAAAMASSLDTIGHFTKTVADSAIVLQYIAGHDPHDATTSTEPLDNYLKESAKDITGLKVGVPKQAFAIAGLDPQVREIVTQSIKKVEELTGQSVIEVDLPHIDYALAAYYIIVPSEVSSNLARYDGIKYGLSERASSLLENYLASRGMGFGDEAKRRIMLGTFSLSHGYYDAYYKKALQIRTLVKQDYEQAFKEVDVIISPVVPHPAFKIGEKISDPLQMYLGDIFTIPASLAGLPALSIPIGQTKENLPIGLQIIGHWFKELDILRVGYNYEKEIRN